VAGDTDVTKPIVDRKHSQVLRRREVVAERYRDGLPLHQIAQEMSVSRQTIWSDLRWVHEKTLEGAVEDYKRRMVRELQRLDWLENEAVEAWEQSKLDAQATSVRSEKVLDHAKQPVGTELVKTQVSKKGQCGDPRFLAQIMNCVQERCKLFGLYAPEKKDIQVTAAQKRERLDKIAARYGLM